MAYVAAHSTKPVLGVLRRFGVERAERDRRSRSRKHERVEAEELARLLLILRHLLARLFARVQPEHVGGHGHVDLPLARRRGIVLILAPADLDERRAARLAR